MVDQSTLRSLTLATFDGDDESAVVLLDAILEDDPDLVSLMAKDKKECMRVMRDLLEVASTVRILSEEKIQCISKSKRFILIYFFEPVVTRLTIRTADKKDDVGHFGWGTNNPGQISGNLSRWRTFVSPEVGIIAEPTVNWEAVEGEDGNAPPVWSSVYTPGTGVVVVTPEELADMQKRGADLRTDIYNKFISSGEAMHARAKVLMGIKPPKKKK